jgi:hypothetical protein
VSAVPTPLSYQWYFNETNALPDATNSVLDLPSIQASQAGTYSVLIGNDFGAVTSAPAMLSIIPPVERRPVPAINLAGEVGALLTVESADSLSLTPNWLSLETVALGSPPQWYFDLSAPLPQQRFYRAWQTGAPGVTPTLALLGVVPALKLSGAIGDKVRVDAINQIGPTDAWFTVATVTLTNATQIYFDTSTIGQPARLYRLVPVP